MTIFAIFRVQDPERMRARLADVYPHDHFDLGNNEFLIAAKGTAKEISDAIGVTGETATAGNAIVLTIESYYGRAASNIWEWIKSKSEATNGQAA